jgi:hypothetical protein
VGYDDAPPMRGPLREWQLRAVVVPACLALAWLIHLSPTGRFLQRTFLSMPVHELGHAVTGWFCGFSAVPGLWKTMIPETRGAFPVLLFGAACGGLGWVGWRFQRRWMLALAAALAALALYGRLGLSTSKAQQLITFGGDGGGLVLGALLMGLFFVDPDARLARSGLRWGFAVIGAVAFVDCYATWWTARHDPDVIPFGEIEGVGQSDPSKLTDQWGWTAHQLITRDVNLGLVCLVALAAVYGYATWRARRDDVGGDPA